MYPCMRHLPVLLFTDCRPFVLESLRGMCLFGESSFTPAWLRLEYRASSKTKSGGLDVIRKEAWSFYRTSSGLRLCWELEEPKGPKVHASRCPTRMQPEVDTDLARENQRERAWCRVQGAGCRVQCAGCRVRQTWRGAPLRVPAHLMIQQGLPRAT